MRHLARHTGTSSYHLRLPLTAYCLLLGLLAALPTSALLRHAGTRPHVYWGVTAGLASCFALLSLLPSYAAPTY